MSRHRFVKNINIADELDDDAFSDEEQDYRKLSLLEARPTALNVKAAEMDSEQQAQMDSGLNSVKSILGSSTLISDEEIKEALWNFYFDVEESVNYLLEENSKKQAAEQRKKEAAQKKREKAAASAPNSGRATPVGTPSKKARKQTGVSKPQPQAVSQLQMDVESLGLSDRETASDVSQRTRESSAEPPESPMPSTSALSIEQIIAEVERRDREEKPNLSLVVVGHVDAGKSTLMGRLLHDIGETADKTLQQNQRQSQKIGKSSFAYAWTFDALPEERERGVTIDIAIDSFSTAHRRFTLIDAPGHRDFIPNMISGATQADTALLVVDASSNSFESGFSENGQTREHAILVRSLGVQQVVVAVNKLDTVGWAQSRFVGICEQLRPFLIQIGFSANRLSFIPCAAFSGENVAVSNTDQLRSWYTGSTLLEQLDTLNIPTRALQAPLRLPVANVFRGQSSGPSGLAVTGRIESGVVQAGQTVAILPGDQVAIVRRLEVDGENEPWATAGQNITAYLGNVDQIYLFTGCVLCPPTDLVPLVSTFQAQIIVFDLSYPILSGFAVELFHHSRDIPASISKLHATLDKASGDILKQNPRMLQAGSSAKVTITLRTTAIPLEPFNINKGMGRILLRREGHTIAAGIVL